MLARIWHGWTKPEHADAYETLLRANVLPGITRVSGYHGAYLMRRSVGDEVEFVTMTIFDDLESVRAFAGEDYTRAVIHEEAGKLLTRYDEHSTHYDIVLTAAEVRDLALKHARDASHPLG